VQKDLLAFIGCDETKAFFFIEEFHFAGWHDYLFSQGFSFYQGRPPKNYCPNNALPSGVS
jgi:hypothetical protein